MDLANQDPYLFAWVLEHHVEVLKEELETVEEEIDEAREEQHGP